MEPKGGFSTNCKACGQHYRIASPDSQIGKKFFSRLLGGDSTPTVPVTHPNRPSVPLQVLGYGEEGDLIAESKPDAFRGAPLQKNYRSVNCFDCHYVHKVASLSSSSMCPNCGSYIDLRDVVIKDRTTQRIRTRGDVTVEKSGALLGTDITCGNLTVDGQVAGSIHASGQVAFGSSGKVLGEVRCGQLLVEKKCVVQFLQPVHAESAEIRGIITGRFEITGRLLLTRRGQIDGFIQAKSMLMEAGSQLDATVEVLPKPLPPIPVPLPSLKSRSSVNPSAATSAESLALWASESAPSPGD